MTDLNNDIIFVHRPLATKPGGPSTGPPVEFRVLTLLKGSDQDKIRCRITHHLLAEDIGGEPNVQYEALSWTWGLENDDASIYITTRDGDEEKRFPVRPNLAQALLHLRRENENRELWVDFICINQKNLAERGAQVKQMFLIYHHAFNVCVWLGEHKHDSEKAIRFVKTQVNDLRNHKAITEESAKDNWKALAALMDRHWFSRRWVVQELTLARNATVHVSNEMMAWEEFELAVSIFNRDAQKLSGYYKISEEANFDHDFFGDVGQMGATRLVHLKSNLFRFNDKGRISDWRLRLTDLVANLWSFEAQDPHDMLYAILSIAQDAHKKVNISPLAQIPQTLTRDDSVFEPQIEGQTLDTSLSQTELSLAKKFVRTMKSLRDEANRTIFNVDYEQNFFSLCTQFLNFVVPGAGEHNLDIILRPWSPFKDKNGETIPLPTWIPTIDHTAFKRMPVSHAPGGYRMTRRHADALVGIETRSSPYNASRLKARTEDWSIEGRQLTVTGFVLDKIAQREDASTFGNIDEDWLVLGGVKGLPNQQNATYQAYESTWRTLVGDRGPNGATTPVYYHKAFQQAMDESVQGIQTENLKRRGYQIIGEFLDRLEAVVTNRVLFKSERHHSLGLAPKTARNGDYICIIRGMSVPVVLRLVEDTTHYKLIGGCYLHSFMDGRAVDIQEGRPSEIEIGVEECKARKRKLEEVETSDTGTQPHKIRSDVNRCDQELANFAEEREHLVTKKFVLV